ncbi:DnaJ protein like [Apostasia shenzhenica]|uniref:DnaJ protein like n=1 Tax=Apostasia shenzhenica TaxID=1088818 RepID=A0A2I0AKP1_9ASPA|nr:DnaJ protein like [Apostasia shenzhenica]
MLHMVDSSLRETHYEVLLVSEDSSYDEIRANYKAAILNYHPDKLNAKLVADGPYHAKQERFLSVQKAWEVLSDPKLRENYDKQLQASRNEIEVVENEIGLGEMMEKVDGDVREFLYHCRCGDYFCVTSVELQEIGISVEQWQGSVVLPCGSCSLKIRLVID